MSRPLILSMPTWKNIYQHIKKDYPPSVFLIRDRMKSVLGFTTREHEAWIPQSVDIGDVRYGTRYKETYMHLDFYNDSKRTMFLLKYSEFISQNTVIDT
jgi:hypothetical protein